MVFVSTVLNFLSIKSETILNFENTQFTVVVFSFFYMGFYPLLKRRQLPDHRSDIILEDVELTFCCLLC